MSRGLMYWIIVLIWVVLVVAGWGGYGSGLHIQQASGAVELLLFVLLGWQVYGPPVHG